MSYVALYRKFRPRTFDEVKGQDHVVQTLRNQVKTGRLQHAYLFCGTRGTGKTSVAKILSRAVNCEHPSEGNPCGACDTCRRILDAASMNVIEIDAASNNGVDHIREIIEEVQYRPTEGRYKVYIIDEVHMLSTGAFNALLKTLEEPPEYVIFILATTEAGKIPVTILSRCQRYDFRRIDTGTISSRMRELLDAEGVQAEEQALRFIARAADGSMRDALSLLDRCIAFYMDEELTYEKALKALGEADTTVFSSLTRLLGNGDAGGAVSLFGRQLERGVEIGQFVTDYIQFLRNLLIVGTSGRAEAAEIIDVTGEQMADLEDIASGMNPETVTRFIRILSDLLNQMRYASNRRVLAETSLILLARPESDMHTDALLQRMRLLELRLDEMMAGGYAVPMREAAGSGQVQADPEEEGEVLSEAAPEDLKQIVADWRRLVASMPPGLLKQQLQENAHPQYNAETLENRLYVEFGGGMQAEAAEVVKQDVYRDEFMRYIERRLGKRVEVEFHIRKERPAGLHTINVEKMIAEGIRFEVDEVPDEEDEGDLF